MRLWKKILLGLGVVVLLLVVLFVVFVGPWPTYSSGFEGKKYFTNALDAIEKNVAESEVTGSPGRLEAGWGVSLMTPAAGVPMAGYSSRRGKGATGAYDDLYVKALALSDGRDTAVLVGSDMLLVPENVAEMVRKDVAKQTSLTPNDIYFSASHSHCGPGAFGPGLAAYITGGKYDPQMPVFLAAAFTDAIVEAYKKLGPAKLANRSVDAEVFIRNRTRNGPVDPELSYLVIENEYGNRCFLVSFSAHPTVMGGSFMEFTGSYPGHLQRAIEEATGATAVYLGGAVGSMSPRAPEGPSQVARSEAFGQALAQLILDDAKDLKFRTDFDVVSIGLPLELPSMQCRVFKSTKWRLSPLAGPLVGLNDNGWMQAVRVGDVVFVGVPADFSGEISAKWKAWGADKGYDLWATSFSADYVGYVSPDEYYGEVVDKHGNPSYETGLMSWCGPHQEAYFTALMRRMIEVMGPAPIEQKTTRGDAPVAHERPVS